MRGILVGTRLLQSRSCKYAQATAAVTRVPCSCVSHASMLHPGPAVQCHGARFLPPLHPQPLVIGAVCGTLRGIGTLRGTLRGIGTLRSTLRGRRERCDLRVAVLLRLDEGPLRVVAVLAAEARGAILLRSDRLVSLCRLALDHVHHRCRRRRGRFRWCAKRRRRGRLRLLLRRHLPIDL